jgi:hypothetical protein
MAISGVWCSGIAVVSPPLGPALRCGANKRPFQSLTGFFTENDTGGEMGKME